MDESAVTQLLLPKPRLLSEGALVKDLAGAGFVSLIGSGIYLDVL